MTAPGDPVAAAPAPSLVLDVTRLISRIGRGHPTGVDRVEAAWLGRVALDPENRLICRVRSGLLLLPAAAGARLLRWLGFDAAGQGEGAPAQPPLPGRGLRALARLIGVDAGRLAVEAALWRAVLAVAGRWRWGGGQGLARALRRAGVPGNAVYLNLGHSNLDARFLAALPLRRVVLVHDTIPLDHPEWTRPGQDAAFRARLVAALDHADLLLTVSVATAARLAVWRARLAPGSVAPIMPAPIGTSLARPDPATVLPEAPYFLTLGTIEPRKNHALLLDAWALLPAPRPRLVIAGRRGWLNADVFARLDAQPVGGPIIEAADLSDGAIAALMCGARALLFPSRAEGFGLPLTEAAARGIETIAGDLPSSREVVGDWPRYLPPDPVAWAEAVTEALHHPARPRPPLSVPGWEGHFETVLDGLRDMPPRGSPNRNRNEVRK